jgi:hypothetical protein
MSIVGRAPESGVRIDMTRPREGGPRWRYEGEAVTPDETFGLVVTVSASGEVSVETAARGAAGDPAIAERVRLLVRAAYKHAQSEGGGEGAMSPPPRRIVRWRADVDLAPPGRGE